MSGRQVRISTVWERTLDVLRGRAGILAGIALLFVFLPNILSGAVAAFGGAELRGVRGLLNLATSVLLLMGLLAITAVATDPAVDRAGGIATGARRIGPALACVVLLALVGLLAIVPVAYLIFSSGATFNPATGAINVANASPGTVGIAGLLSIFLLIVGLWLNARLVPLFGVIVNERRGLGALTHSFALTRGATLRLMGVIILYAVVLLVVGLAVTSVVGVVAALLFGSGAGAAFCVSVVSGALAAIATTVQTAFYAQYYVAADADEHGMRGTVHPPA